MFSIRRPLRTDTSRPSAPYIPVSSSTVKMASMAGWDRESSSRMAMAMATAMPSSPPRVVPLAETVSPSSTRSRPSAAMSLVQPGSFSQTMSM